MLVVIEVEDENIHLDIHEALLCSTLLTLHRVRTYGAHPFITTRWTMTCSSGGSIASRLTASGLAVRRAAASKTMDTASPGARR